jgi:hypothetical protein
MATFTIDIPASAVPVVTQALALWAQTQGMNTGTIPERARWALRRFVGMAVKQYRAAAVQAKAEADYQVAQAAVEAEVTALEGAITTS